MNILIIADISTWAIGHLTDSIIKHNKRYNFFTIYAHPRDIAPAIREVQEILRKHKIDLVHGMYWRSATQLIDLIPELKSIPRIASHHNTAHLGKADWKKYFTYLVAPTRIVLKELKTKHDYVAYIPYGINLEDFTYIKDRTDNGKTIGYVGRVIEHKNLATICTVAKEQGLKVLGSGYIEDRKYWDTVDQTVLEFYGGFGRGQMNSWDYKNSLYDQMTVFAMQATSYETGPLPMLEAMAKGIPVIATRQGMAADLIEHGKNGLLCEPDEFGEELKRLIADRDLQETLRRNARKTMHQYSAEKMALLYGNLYTTLVYPNKKTVSVIIPTYNRNANIREILSALETQTYKPFEAVVIDDSENNETKEYIEENKNQYHFPIVYIKKEHSGYGLATARNMGIIEARGELLVFCDDRLKMDANAIEQFIIHTQPGQWHYGAKYVGGKPSANTSFVENFSAVHRIDLVKIGLFNERINMYGGMSQDIRERCLLNGIGHKRIEGAKAYQINGTEKMKKPDEQAKAKLLLYKLYGR